MNQEHVNCGCSGGAADAGSAGQGGGAGESRSAGDGMHGSLPIREARVNTAGEYPNPLVDAVEVDGDGRPGGYGNNSFCEKIFDELNDLLESPCNEARRRAIMDAVNSCPQCFEAYGIEQAVRDLLKQCCCEPAPETLRTKIRVVIDRVHVEGH